jgi:hypothetical protein
MHRSLSGSWLRGKSRIAGSSLAMPFGRKPIDKEDTKIKKLEMIYLLEKH